MDKEINENVKKKKNVIACMLCTVQFPCAECII